MILVDSSVWIDYFRGAPTPEADSLDALLGEAELVVGDLVLTEVLQGFRTDAMRQERLLVNNPRPIGECDARRIYGAAL